MEENELKYMHQYMVEFVVPPELADEIEDMIEEQQEIVDSLFAAGKLLSYSMSSDFKKIWAVLLASTESELILTIDYLPMTEFVEYNYEELNFHNTVHLLPSMSLN